MLPSIIIVDDEVEVLKALERVLMHDYRVTTFTNAKSAIAHFKETPSHIVLSDLMMPEMNGGEFLAEIAKMNGKTKRVALTGHASAELAEQAINEGKISLYLTKPWDNKALKEKLSNLIEELKTENKKQRFTNQLGLSNKKLLLEQQSQVIVHSLMVDEKEKQAQELLKLKGSINELLLLNANSVALYSNEVAGHSVRVAQHARAIIQKLTNNNKLSVEAYFAGVFHRLGMMSIESSLQNAPWFSLNLQQQNEYLGYVHVSADVMSTTSILNGSAEIVRHIFEPPSAQKVDINSESGQVLLAAQLLRVAIDFDLLINGRLSEHNMTPNQAITEIEGKKDINYSETAIELFLNMLANPNEYETIQLAKIMTALDEGMVLAQDLFDSLEHKLLSKETILNSSMIEKLYEIQREQQSSILAYVYNKSE